MAEGKGRLLLLLLLLLLLKLLQRRPMRPCGASRGIGVPRLLSGMMFLATRKERAFLVRCCRSLRSAA